jgi:glycosyltransferase involved in cell wall biosynthesis
MSLTTFVVPCFNEESRLPFDALAQLAAARDVSLLLVDDGSSDGTRARLEDLARATPSPERVRVLGLDANVGKGEAVRRGLLAALADGAAIVGYADADLATPVPELVRLRDELERRGLEVVTGARVKLVGVDIDRRAMRHYLGRVFATGAALVLRTPYYDTQCGAKLFRRSALLERALARPFHSRWAFDVELLGRLLAGVDGERGIDLTLLRELPLETWIDVGESKLGAGGMLRAGVDLLRISRHLDGLRREARGVSRFASPFAAPDREAQGGVASGSAGAKTSARPPAGSISPRSAPGFGTNVSRPATPSEVSATGGPKRA